MVGVLGPLTAECPLWREHPTPNTHTQTFKNIFE